MEKRRTLNIPEEEKRMEAKVVKANGGGLFGRANWIKRAMEIGVILGA